MGLGKVPMKAGGGAKRNVSLKVWLRTYPVDGDLYTG